MEILDNLKDIDNQTDKPKEPKLGDYRIIKITGNISKNTTYKIQVYSRFFYFWRKWLYLKSTKEIRGFWYNTFADYEFKFIEDVKTFIERNSHEFEHSSTEVINPED